MHHNFKLKLDMWWRADFHPVADFDIMGATKVVAGIADPGRTRASKVPAAGLTDPSYSTDPSYRADENDCVASVFEPLRRDVLFVINQTDHRDGGRWIDNSGRALII